MMKIIEIVVGNKNYQIGWTKVKGNTDDLARIYDDIYKNGSLKYEIETFDNDGKCEIWYYR